MARTDNLSPRAVQTLLPEAIPFVAELLEDPDVAVEAAAQRLVAQLETLSGEKLDQYLRT